MKDYDYYYFNPSTTNGSGLTTMAKKLVDEAKARHSYVVYGKDAVPQVVAELKSRAEELKKENPRWKMPDISFDVNAWTGDGMLKIDDWSFICYKVKNIIHF